MVASIAYHTRLLSSFSLRRRRCEDAPVTFAAGVVGAVTVGRPLSNEPAKKMKLVVVLILILVVIVRGGYVETSLPGTLGGVQTRNNKLIVASEAFKQSAARGLPEPRRDHTQAVRNVAASALLAENSPMHAYYNFYF